ncbi:MAG TPA: ABC transporter ATP-binding protein [Candidatus Nanoarchaeia archaeon]|nr:ABC transporter ATP-binding protein [Candidatus Nanoarchaeia archaeon]
MPNDITKVKRPTSTDQALLVVKDLRKKYGDFEAVKGVSFEVKAGEVFGILGPNGAGKTTTLEMIEGMRPIDKGSATLDGVSVAKHPFQIKEMIGVQLQSSSFFDNLSLTEILFLFGDLYGQSAHPDELLKEVNLQEKAKARVKNLSGGQKQRFSIAAALVNNPIAIFLDEPTTGLDPQARRNLWDLVQQIQAKGTTVILTTHYMEEAQVLCNRVAIMDAGKIIALDTPDRLIADLLGRGFEPKTNVAKATLEDVFIDLTGKDLRE